MGWSHRLKVSSEVKWFHRVGRLRRQQPQTLLPLFSKTLEWWLSFLNLVYFFFFNSMVDNLERLRCCVFVCFFYHFGRDESDWRLNVLNGVCRDRGKWVLRKAFNFCISKVKSNRAVWVNGSLFWREGLSWQKF